MEQEEKAHELEELLISALFFTIIFQGSGIQLSLPFFGALSVLFLCSGEYTYFLKSLLCGGAIAASGLLC